MPAYRKTAVVELALPSSAAAGSLPLACEREFGVLLTIEGTTCPAQNFQSPINDAQWRGFMDQLRDCNVQRSEQTGYRPATAMRALARSLYRSLAQLSPALSDFLAEAGTPRRLVLQTTRPELHLLPWAAMYDESNQPVAAGNLSVVHCWSGFTQAPLVAGRKVNLACVLGIDTNQVTAPALAMLATTPEIVQTDVGDAFANGQRVEAMDLLHLEEHGNLVNQNTGQTPPEKLADSFPSLKIALLWSCFSGAENSWGESPALCLHRHPQGAGLVLSFLAELHTADAASIAQAFYGDVFGPAASRDLETALVKIRAQKIRDEFAFGNWASMMVFLRAPLDLSALPLNGPRVPARGWVDALPVSQDQEFWTNVTSQVQSLTPGTLVGINAMKVNSTMLPREAFAAWRGNVIRIDEQWESLPDADTLRELGVNEPDPATMLRTNTAFSDPSDRLAWFFERIAHFGSPLIVWTSAAPRHMEFLQTVNPPSNLTFLLLYGPRPEQPTMMELVDENRLEEALERCPCLPAGCSDEELHAAYYACVRGDHPNDALTYLARVGSLQERLLLAGNYLSRYPKTNVATALKPLLGTLPVEAVLERPEDFYLLAIHLPEEIRSLRETGRARHQMGYQMSRRGRSETAELLFRIALNDIESSGLDPAVRRDSRWYFSLSSILRDWADMMANDPGQIDAASVRLKRATAIQAYHGMKLELAYSGTTAARIALAKSRCAAAVTLAMEAANRFVACSNWNGWYEALRTIFQSLAEMRDSERMIGIAELAGKKLETAKLSARLSEEKLASFHHDLTWQRARARWIAGRLDEARQELENLKAGADGADQNAAEIALLTQFLALPQTPNAPQGKKTAAPQNTSQTK